MFEHSQCTITMYRFLEFLQQRGFRERIWVACMHAASFFALSEWLVSPPATRLFVASHFPFGCKENNSDGATPR